MTLLCRTCASVIYNKNAINLFEIENLEILTNIEMVVGAALESDADLPSHICGCCLLDLKRAVYHIKTFRERSTRAQEQLQDTQTILVRTSWEKDLNGENELTENGNHVANEEVPFDYDEDLQKIYKLQADDDIEDLIGFQEEENVQDMLTNITDDSDLDVDSLIASVRKEINSSDSQESVERFENISDNDLSPIDSNHIIEFVFESSETIKTETGKDKIFSAHSQDDADEDGTNKCHKVKVKKKSYASWKNLTEEQVIQRKRQQRRRDCMCDQCGRHFTDQSNFKLHMLRHAGIKDFKCRQCSKEFYTDHLLQLHERIVHQGERPYACKYCDKTFHNSTSRVVHERYHTNVRPYSCKFCGKAFSSASGLKRHLLIHNGVRAYFCSICDRNFQRNTHLKAHLRSKQHALKQANENLLREL